MSVEVELNKKAGRVCSKAMNGEIRCPLIVRQSSEDVVTGTVFGSLRHIRPHLWLGPMLNLAFETTGFRQMYYRQLSIRFWERQERFPPELLEFNEGKSEIDLIIEWENEPTTIWIEAKLWSNLSTGTTHCDTNDQVLRGVRTLLGATGHIGGNRLFRTPKRRPIWLALLSQKPHPVVEQYREASFLQSKLPHCSLDFTQGPPVIGTLTWGDVKGVVAERRSKMNCTEQAVTDQLIAYLDLKLSELPAGSALDNSTTATNGRLPIHGTPKAIAKLGAFPPTF